MLYSPAFFVPTAVRGCPLMGASPGPFLVYPSSTGAQRILPALAEYDGYATYASGPEGPSPVYPIKLFPSGPA
jgi:hypothetical protein